MSAVEPIRWKGDRLELLDQRLLPDQQVYVTCRTAAEVATAIRDITAESAEIRAFERIVRARLGFSLGTCIASFGEWSKSKTGKIEAAAAQRS